MDRTEMAAAVSQWNETRQAEVLGELLKAQRDRAYSSAVHLIGSQFDAEDVVQQAFIKLLLRTHPFENVEAFELSVYRAVVQCALDSIRQRNRRLARETEASKINNKGDEPVAQPFDAETERKESLALLRAAVTELPEEERVPVVLCYYQGLSSTQSAKVLELPRETLRARLARALKRLRVVLSQHDKDVSVPQILALLWTDGALPAPPALCKALDKALPGQPCAHVAPMARTMAPAAQSAGVSVTTVATAVAVVAALGVGGFLLVRQQRAGLENAASKSNSVVMAQRLNQSSAPRVEGLNNEPVRPLSESREEEKMKSKLGALVLASGMLMAGAVSADEPNASVAKVIAQIEARRADKAAVETKARSYSDRERSEGANSGGWQQVQVKQAVPGGAVFVNPGQ